MQSPMAHVLHTPSGTRKKTQGSLVNDSPAAPVCSQGACRHGDSLSQSQTLETDPTPHATSASWGMGGGVLTLLLWEIISRGLAWPLTNGGGCWHHTGRRSRVSESSRMALKRSATTVESATSTHPPLSREHPFPVVVSTPCCSWRIFYPHSLVQANSPSGVCPVVGLVSTPQQRGSICWSCSRVELGYVILHLRTRRDGGWRCGRTGA